MKLIKLSVEFQNIRIAHQIPWLLRGCQIFKVVVNNIPTPPGYSLLPSEWFSD